MFSSVLKCKLFFMTKLSHLVTKNVNALLPSVSSLSNPRLVKNLFNETV